MFKAITLIALGAVASAQFLDSRDLQGEGVILSQTSNSTTVVNATAFATACTSSATADSCPSDYCCAKLTRGISPVLTTVAAAVCSPVEFHNVTFSINGITNIFLCNQLFNVNTFNNRTSSRSACNDTTACAVGSCCATFTDFFGTATSNATITNRRFCLDGTKSGDQLWATYAAANIGAGQSARITQGSCTNVLPPPAVKSFGAYIKASAMMLVAVLSVAFF